MSAQLDERADRIGPNAAVPIIRNGCNRRSWRGWRGPSLDQAGFEKCQPKASTRLKAGAAEPCAVNNSYQVCLPARRLPVGGCCAVLRGAAVCAATCTV